MYLIVGLGNPGEKYAKTRHNLGFMVVDEVARKILPLGKTRWVEDKKANALILKASPEVFLVKPQTFMNASGMAVARLTRRYTLDAKSLWVIHDDVDLPLSKLKIRLGGAAAGHHGVESIIKELGTKNFVRFRIGIQPKTGKPKNIEKFVLQKPSEAKPSEAGDETKSQRPSV